MPSAIGARPAVPSDAIAVEAFVDGCVYALLLPSRFIKLTLASSFFLPHFWLRREGD